MMTTSCPIRLAAPQQTEFDPKKREFMTTLSRTTQTAPTFADIALPDEVRDALSQRLLALPDPTVHPDRASAHLLQAFAAELPTDLLQHILDFGRHVAAPGVALVTNLPVDSKLPPTPTDGRPSKIKQTFVAEAVVLGLSQLIGEPIGFLTEKAGQLIHDVIPVAAGATTQTNQGSKVFLNFHNDIVYDHIGRYNVSNPDFLVLHCLRADPAGQAQTFYADARDVIDFLDSETVEVLRSPLFRLNAPGSYVRDVASGAMVWSDPVPLISGPEHAPEIATSANGVQGMTTRAQQAFDRMQEACRYDDVAHAVQLRPGQALLINNRKGLHARSQFTAHHDGTDRWLQRTYVRRSLWTIRYRATDGNGRVHQ
jgi:L-asparagine oxygenase